MTDRWKLGLINSAWFGSPWEGLPGLQKTKEIGFDSMDIFMGFDPGELTKQERQSFLREVKGVGLPVPSIICTALGLSDFNQAVRRYHIDRAKRIVEIAAEMESPTNILFVPGEYMFQKDLIPPSDEWGRVVSATREVGIHAAERGLELAVELLPFEYAFIRTVDDLLLLFEQVGLENVKASMDISHLWLMRIDPKEVAKLKGQIAHVHLADCDGENHGDLPMGRGNTPFPAYLAAIRDAGYSGAASVELEFPPDPTMMVDWVTEAFREARRLLHEAGVHD